VGRGRGGRRPPTFFDRGTRPPPPPLFWIKIRAKVSPLLQLVILAETQCKIISVQHVCRPKLFKNLCLSLVAGVPHFFFRTTPLSTLHVY